MRRERCVERESRIEEREREGEIFKERGGTVRRWWRSPEEWRRKEKKRKKRKKKKKNYLIIIILASNLTSSEQCLKITENRKYYLET